MAQSDLWAQPQVVCLCITELEPGGAEKNLVELATRLDRRLFRPEVVALKSAPSPNRSQLVTKLVAHGIFPKFLAARYLAGLPWTLARLRRHLNHIHPSVVQCFLFHANFLGAVAARLAKVPVVCAGIRVAERGKTWHLWAQALLRPLVTKFVCVSQATAQHLMDRCGIPASKMAVIPNGIDLTACDRTVPAEWKSWGLPPSADVILYVGRLDYQKGIDCLVKLAPQLVEPSPGCEPYLVVVGDGPLRPMVEKAAGSTDLGGRVRYLGWQADTLGLIRACRLLVLPSRWEGMPNVVLEAMACDRPVVATDVEGVSELLGEGAAIQAVPWGDWDVFVRRVRGILQDRQLAARLGQANRKRVESHFTVDRMVAAYQELWINCLKQKAVTGPGSGGSASRCPV